MVYIYTAPNPFCRLKNFFVILPHISACIYHVFCVFSLNLCIYDARQHSATTSLYISGLRSLLLRPEQTFTSIVLSPQSPPSTKANLHLYRVISVVSSSYQSKLVPLSCYLRSFLLRPKQTCTSIVLSPQSLLPT